MAEEEEGWGSDDVGDGAGDDDGWGEVDDGGGDDGAEGWGEDDPEAEEAVNDAGQEEAAADAARLQAEKEAAEAEVARLEAEKEAAAAAAAEEAELAAAAAAAAAGKKNKNRSKWGAKFKAAGKMTMMASRAKVRVAAAEAKAAAAKAKAEAAMQDAMESTLAVANASAEEQAEAMAAAIAAATAASEQRTESEAAEAELEEAKAELTAEEAAKKKAEEEAAERDRKEAEEAAKQAAIAAEKEAARLAREEAGEPLPEEMLPGYHYEESCNEDYSGFFGGIKDAFRVELSHNPRVAREREDRARAQAQALKDPNLHDFKPQLTSPGFCFHCDKSRESHPAALAAMQAAAAAVAVANAAVEDIETQHAHPKRHAYCAPVFGTECAVCGIAQLRHPLQKQLTDAKDRAFLAADGIYIETPEAAIQLDNDSAKLIQAIHRGRKARLTLAATSKSIRIFMPKYKKLPSVEESKADAEEQKHEGGHLTPPSDPLHDPASSEQPPSLSLANGGASGDGAGKPAPAKPEKPKKVSFHPKTPVRYYHDSENEEAVEITGIYGALITLRERLGQKIRFGFGNLTAKEQDPSRHRYQAELFSTHCEICGNPQFDHPAEVIKQARLASYEAASMARAAAGWGAEFWRHTQLGMHDFEAEWTGTACALCGLEKEAHPDQQLKEVKSALKPAVTAAKDAAYDAMVAARGCALHEHDFTPEFMGEACATCGNLRFRHVDQVVKQAVSVAKLAARQAVTSAGEAAEWASGEPESVGVVLSMLAGEISEQMGWDGDDGDEEAKAPSDRTNTNEGGGMMEQAYSAIDSKIGGITDAILGTGEQEGKDGTTDAASVDGAASGADAAASGAASAAAPEPEGAPPAPP